MKTLILLLISVFALGCSKNASFHQAEKPSSIVCPTCQPPPVSPLCLNPQDYNSENPNYPDFSPLITPVVDTQCSTGFELNNFIRSGNGEHSSVFRFLTSSGQPTPYERRAFIEYATYIAPDSIYIRAISSNGQSTDLYSSCLMRTWLNVDPTSGIARPPDETIRQWSIKIPAGTVALEFDYSGVVSPTYLSFHGSCDFQARAPAGLEDPDHRFRPY